MEDFRFNFERLAVWQKARELSKKIYDVTRTFPAEERYGLALQLRRAVVSVASNIAEGTGRRSIKDQIRFLEIAYGSLLEVCCQMQLGADTGFVSEENFSECRECIREIGLMLNALRKSFETRS